MIKLNNTTLRTLSYQQGIAIEAPHISIFEQWNQIDIYVHEYGNEWDSESVQSRIEQYIDAIGKMFKAEYPEGMLSGLNLHFVNLPFDSVIPAQRIQDGWYYSDPFVQFADFLEAGGFNAVYVEHTPERYDAIREHGVNFVFGDWEEVSADTLPDTP